LCIVDYSHGLTGSVHDATAFEHTTAAKYPDWFFSRDEFAWADSAYPVRSHLIPVHKKPASLESLNSFFDCVVAHLCVRSEHCMSSQGSFSVQEPSSLEKDWVEVRVASLRAASRGL
jgi:hypothetical protein